MKLSGWVAFAVEVAEAPGPLNVRVSEMHGRAVASVVVGGASLDGLGPTAREALAAALAPLGTNVTSRVLAAPAMFAASAELLAARAAV